MKKLLVLALAAMCMANACMSEVNVCALPDNQNPMKMTPALFAGASAELIDSLGVHDGIPSSLCSYLVQKDGKNILIDSGNGNEDSQLIPALKVHGLVPEDIDYVLLTHLHGDHTGGLTRAGEAVFTNAEVYINKVEYEGWGNVPESEMGKAYDGRIVLFDADSDLPCGIKAVEAYGHTPGHTMYRVNDILFAGDIMHAVALQLVDPDICARFDQDQEASASSRKALLEYAAEEGLEVYGAHFPEPYYLQF